MVRELSAVKRERGSRLQVNELCLRFNEVRLVQPWMGCRSPLRLFPWRSSCLRLGSVRRGCKSPEILALFRVMEVRAVSSDNVWGSGC